MNYDAFEIQRYAVVDVIKEKILSETTLNAWAEFVLTKYRNKELKKSEIGQKGTVSENVRGDFIYWLNPDSSDKITKECLIFLNNIREELNRVFFLNLKKLESHLTVYPPGGVYEKHLDVFKAQTPHSLQRKVSLILYLNQDMKPSDKGELVLYDHNNKAIEEVYPQFGRLVYFLSEEFPHEVRATLNRERISLTAWFLG